MILQAILGPKKTIYLGGGYTFSHFSNFGPKSGGNALFPLFIARNTGCVTSFDALNALEPKKVGNPPKKCVTFEYVFFWRQKWRFLVIFGDFWPFFGLFLAPKAPNRSETAPQAPLHRLGRRRRPNLQFKAQKTAFLGQKMVIFGHFWPFLAIFGQK